MIREVRYNWPIHTIMEAIKFTHPATKPCPFCGEIIQGRAVKCRYCAEFLDTPEARAAEAANQSGPSEEQGDVLFSGRPSLWGLAGTILKGLFFFAFAIFLMKFPVEDSVSEIGSLMNFQLTENQALAFEELRIIAGWGISVLVLLVLLFKMVQLKMTYYEVSAERIEWSRGILDRRIDNIDMFRVVDLQMRRSMLDCIFSIGTVKLMTTDKSDPEFEFEKVRRPRELYDCIKAASLEADKDNRVVHIE
ncbi:MAG: PH domain-containing protein [Planctomycetes bacterium]|nr:PH domain-containing protein [Planctomycetota bacterium]